MRQNWKNHWHQLCDQVLSDVTSAENLSLGLKGEESTFLRFNAGKLRQGTDVDHVSCEMTYQSQQKRLLIQFQLSGDLQNDLKTAQSLLTRAREEIKYLPEDPHVNEVINNGHSETVLRSHLPNEKEAIESILDSCQGVDYAGFYSGGPIFRGSRNSQGQDHWFQNHTFFFDYSLFTVTESVQGDAPENKAVKGHYSDKDWSFDRLKENVQESKEQLIPLKKPSRSLPPGSYPVFLAPAAVSEIAGMFSWRSFSYAAYKQGQSSMSRLAEGKESFSEKFSLCENFKLGLAPRFNLQGEVAPEKISIVEKGQLKNWLVSHRSAEEYKVISNAAETSGWFYEAFRCAEIHPGQLALHSALKKLGTGVYLGNLHYINWSDLTHARMTGMTRYACFWVENGEIVAPIKDMRFDESLYRVFGSELVDFTIEQELEPNVDTYLRRELGGKKIPGALLKDFRFTL